tara:strand:- start:2859 stop:3032 length:174 start_codon:yes stop_codon:yes gene_type:complete
MKRPPFARRRLAALTGALLLGSTVMLASGATHADTTTARHYEVAAGSLENALNQFGR